MGNLLFFIVGKFSFYEIVFICSSDCVLEQRTSFDYFFTIFIIIIITTIIYKLTFVPIFFELYNKDIEKVLIAN